MSATKNLLPSNILDLLGLSRLSEEKQAKILERIAGLIEKRVLYRLITEMDGELAKEAEGVFASGTDEDKLNFLQTKTNMVRVMEEEVINMKDELLKEVEDLQPQE